MWTQRAGRGVSAKNGGADGASVRDDFTVLSVSGRSLACSTCQGSCACQSSSSTAQHQVVRPRLVLRTSARQTKQPFIPGVYVKSLPPSRQSIVGMPGLEGNPSLVGMLWNVPPILGHTAVVRML